MSDITVAGYVELEGVRTFNDQTLKYIWDQLVKDGTTYLFNKDEISNSDEFIVFMKLANVFPAIVLIDNEIGGFGWVQSVKKNSAEANHFMFKKYWGKHTVEMAKALTKYWFSFKNEEGGQFFDVLVGYTSKANQKACKFVEHIGWKILGTIPYLDEGDDMLISYAIREIEAKNNG